MTKNFKIEKDGYIKFTEKELKALLDEVYNAGRADERRFYWSSPTSNTIPYIWCSSTCNDKSYSTTSSSSIVDSSITTSNIKTYLDGNNLTVKY